VVCAINVVVQTHPISSAISLVGVMGSLAVLYLLLGAEFLAIAQIIVYAGAIMVLFVFVVMLLNAGREDRTLGSRAATIIGFPAVAVLLALLATLFLRIQGLGAAHPGQVLAAAPAVRGATDNSNLAQLSPVLFRDLLLPFEVTSVLILIAILGAVALARHAEGSEADAERTAAK